jgi:DNA uptake protein ComE-like DNA-binding protein
MRNTLVLLALVLSALSAVLAQGQKAKDEVWVELLPPGEGRELVLDSCVSCHNLKVVVLTRKSRADWVLSMNDMIQRGAPVFPEEIEPITAYLSKAFGTAVPKPVNVNSVSREELEKLPNLKPEMADRILETRGKAGPFKNSEELRRAIGIEKKDFEKIVYLFKYSD